MNFNLSEININWKEWKSYDDILFQSLEHILNKPEINELLNFINENEIFLNIECNCIEKNNIKNKLCKLRKEDCTIHKSPNFYGTHLAYQEYLKMKD